MARSRFDKLDDDERAEILREAGETFAENGYGEASLNAIIERAGISKGSLYYYFENKEDLFVTVVERATDRVLEQIGGVSLEDLTADRFWEELEGLSHRAFEHLTSDRWYVRLGRTLYRMRDRDADNPSRVVFERMRTWVERFVERGRQLGVVRDDMPRDLLVEIAMAVGEAEDRWLLEHFDDLSDEELEREVGRMIHLYRCMLEPEERDDS
jgi:AcrR family transcriptional regulator